MEMAEELKIAELYKMVFRGPVPVQVLADMLKVCGYGATLDPDDHEAIGRYNFAVDLLAKCDLQPIKMLLGITRPFSEVKLVVTDNRAIIVKSSYLRKILVMLGFGEFPPEGT
jgi:hypothetical protein